MCAGYGNGVCAVSAIVERDDGTLVVTVRLTLKPGRDDALITLVRSAPYRGLAASVREAMRNGASQYVAFEEIDEDNFDLPDLGTEL